MDAKEGIMMWKLRWMDREGIIISKLKGWMDERVLGHFYALSRLNWAGDKLKGYMEKGGHYDVEIKGWMQKGGQMLRLNMGIPNFCNFCPFYRLIICFFLECILFHNWPTD